MTGPRRFSRRQLLIGGAGALAAAAVGGSAYGVFVEPHWVELVRRRMPLEHLPPELQGRTLLHVSDLHVGPRVSSDYLVRAFHDAQALTPAEYLKIVHDLRGIHRVLSEVPNE